MNTSANGFRRGMEDAHAEAAGALCLDDGSGCCAACGVALVPCDRCAGVGYHRAGCAAADDGTPEEGDRAQPEATEEEARAARCWQNEHGEPSARTALEAIRRGGPERLARYGGAS